jgi:hypothetical protein
MARYARNVDVSAWVEVERNAPCPVCGEAARCSIHANGEFVRCMTLVSQRPVLAGGWLHPVPSVAPSVRELAASA